MDEQKKYEVIKHLVDNGGNKERAAMTLGITKRQVNRLIKALQGKGKVGIPSRQQGKKTSYYDCPGDQAGCCRPLQNQIL